MCFYLVFESWRARVEWVNNNAREMRVTLLYRALNFKSNGITCVPANIGTSRMNFGFSLNFPRNFWRALRAPVRRENLRVRL